MTKKDPAAVSLGKKRWAGMTAEQRREAMAKIQAKRNMSPEARKAMGKRLTEARKAKRRVTND